MTGAEKNKPGRPCLAAGAGKTARVQLRVPPADKAAWLAAAALAGVSLQVWVQRKCRAGLNRHGAKPR